MNDRYLSVPEAAELLGTAERFPRRFSRRLIAERRIAFVRLGRHVRIPDSAPRAFVEANTVQPMSSGRARLGAVA